MSLILLWTLFYEQYSDKILFNIKFHIRNKYEDEQCKNPGKVSLNEQFVIISSSQSLVFVMQVVFASLPFIISLSSYKHTGIK